MTCLGNVKIQILKSWYIIGLSLSMDLDLSCIEERW